MVTKNVTALVVDDDDICQLMVARALSDLGSPLRVVTASDGVAGMELLRAKDTGHSLAHPFIVLLDLRMPRMNGLEFLEHLRRDPVLHSVTVFMLTTSKQEQDIRTAYHANVAGYLVKPDRFSDFQDMMRMVDHYCRRVVFPPQPAVWGSAVETADGMERVLA